MTNDELLGELYDKTLTGNGPAVLDLTNQGLGQGLGPETLLYEALIPALEEVGARFERGDFFVPEMLIAQNIPRIRGDAFDAISCLTAVTLDGKVLWQLGRPDPRNGLLTNATPFQIHDIDGDGKNEVVLVRDFQLQILEGATGKLKKSVFMPKMPPTDAEHPYEFENGDSIGVE